MLTVLLLAIAVKIRLSVATTISVFCVVYLYPYSDPQFHWMMTCTRLNGLWWINTTTLFLSLARFFVFVFVYVYVRCFICNFFSFWFSHFVRSVLIWAINLNNDTTKSSLNLFNSNTRFVYLRYRFKFTLVSLNVFIKILICHFFTVNITRFVAQDLYIKFRWNIFGKWIVRFFRCCCCWRKYGSKRRI